MTSCSPTRPTVGRRFVPPRAPRSASPPGLARRPARAARRVGGLGAELARVAAGRSELRPAKRDRRFADPAWESSWLFRRLLQTHLAVEATVDGLISDAELDWRARAPGALRRRQRARRARPEQLPVVEPGRVKETVDQGGAEPRPRRARDFAARLPAPAVHGRHQPVRGRREPRAHAGLGRAAHRGVRADPVRAADRARSARSRCCSRRRRSTSSTCSTSRPGRSMVEWLVRQGQQVFAISWRNPDAEQGHFDLDTYAAAMLEARDAVAAITGRPRVHLNGACSGGIISAGALGHLAAEGRLGDVASLTLLVAALDNERAGTAAALAGREAAAAAVAESARRGYLDGQALAGVFTWLRPNDLVWNYVVNNYLLGKQPPAFDVLYWNQDTRPARRRPAPRLHPPRRSRTRSPRPESLEVLGSPVDLGAVDLDSYVVAGLDRPHHPVGERLPQHAAARRRRRASCSLRAATSRRWSTRRPTASRSSYRVDRRASGDAEAWAQQAATQPGQLVARLRRVARRALRRAQARPQAARRRPLQGARQGARHLRPRRLREESTCRPSPFPTRTSATRWRPTTSRSATSSPTSSGSTSCATRRFVDDEVLPAINDYWEARRAAVAADAPARRPRPLRRGHHRLRLPGHEPARARPRQHGAAPRRRQPRHLPRRPVRARDEVDRPARLRGAEGALAAGAGAARGDRRVRADRARARLGLGRAGDQRAPRRRRLGARRRQALDRQRLDRRRRGRLGALGRGRPGQGLPRREGHARLPGEHDGAARARRARSGRPTSRLDGVRVPEAVAAARRRVVQGCRPRARHHAHDVRVGRARATRSRPTTPR